MVDHTLKHHMMLLSSASLEWMKDDASPLNWTPSNEKSSSMTVTERFLQALFYYQYPSADITRLSEGRGENEHEKAAFSDLNPFYRDLRENWEKSLNAATNMTLHQPNRSFYVCARDFTLFVSHSSSSHLVACINRTSLTLRRKLVQFGVVFSFPMLILQPHQDDDEVDEEVALVQNASIDNTIQSLITIEGLERIQLLIGFFIANYRDEAKWLGHCPNILSSFPFVLASLQRLVVSVSTSKMLNSSSFEKVHTATFSGVVLPETFQKLCSTFQEALPADTSASLTCSSMKTSEWCGHRMIEAHAFCDATTTTTTTTTTEKRRDENDLNVGTFIGAVITPNNFKYTCTMTVL
jgi:hypothetical protein